MADNCTDNIIVHQIKNNPEVLRGDYEEYRVLKSDAVYSGKDKGKVHPITVNQDT